MQELSPKERVLLALKLKEPDRVPWVESQVSRLLVQKITSYNRGHHKNIRIVPEVLEVLSLDNLCYNFSPPRFAEVEKHGDLDIVSAGKIKNWNDFEFYKKKMPDPGSRDIYAPAEDYLKKYKKDYASVAFLRFGASNTYLSMGIEHFSYTLYDDPALIDALMDMFFSYNVKVLEVVQNMDFDIIYVSDDLAFKTSLLISKKHMERFFMGCLKKMAEKMKKPWIFHSCGNINMIFDDLLQLRMNGISNLEPGPMDIFQLKKDYGNQVCLMGNIDISYTLSLGTEEETENEVREKIEKVGVGGGYILASSNNPTPYCKPENILAMNRALLKYGYYS